MIDWTVNFGHILMFATFITTVVGAYFALKSVVGMLTYKLDNFGGRVINIETELREMSKIMTAVAVQDERFVNLEKRFTNLELASEAHRKWVREVILTPRLHKGVGYIGEDGG